MQIYQDLNPWQSLKEHFTEKFKIHSLPTRPSASGKNSGGVPPSTKHFCTVLQHWTTQKNGDFQVCRRPKSSNWFEKILFPPFSFNQNLHFSRWLEVSALSVDSCCAVQATGSRGAFPRFGASALHFNGKSLSRVLKEIVPRRTISMNH